MHTSVRRSSVIAFIAALLMLHSAFAYADAATDASVVPSTVSAWTGLVVTLLALGAWAIRAFTPDTNFAHTKMGALVISAGCAVLSAASDGIRTGGLHVSVILPAVMGALAPLLSMSNPTAVSQARAERAERGTTRGGLILALAGMGLAFVLVFCSIGCAAGRALGACELAKLPNTSQVVIADVTAIATSAGSNWEAQLEALGMQLLPGQLDCVIQALVTAWSTRGAALPVEHLVGLTRMKKYQADHPKHACVAQPRG